MALKELLQNISKVGAVSVMKLLEGHNIGPKPTIDDGFFLLCPAKRSAKHS